MSKLITFETYQFLSLVDKILRQDDGVSSEVYAELLQSVSDYPDIYDRINTRTDATDGRFYLPDDALPLTAGKYIS